ncbi:hypothetical protein CCAX7_58040 [Capsulimonas corticalis]|uniref:Uncharacterized protein n=1 Tax=Capsulimonas corticalis TaxID=2219043 RepID=A0A402D017_9BACT|nr:permease prefix domain 1-containing protein [Capsulimonas corticalis]BDI33753.1 hypothetical protein CCAX7_58040 [Capsulimonas corticalis]
MHRLLDGYLNEVASYLGGMPESRRTDELREMCTHLEDAVAVSVEHGASEEEAVRTAVSQFGAATAVAGEALSAWKRERKQARISYWGAAALSLACHYSFAFLMSLMIKPYYHIPLAPSDLSKLFLFVNVGNIVFPLLAGGIAGSIFPARAVAGARLGVILTILRWGVFTLPGVVHQFAKMDSSSLTLFIVQSFFFLLLEGAILLFAAWMASRLRLSISGRSRLARH